MKYKKLVMQSTVVCVSLAAATYASVSSMTSTLPDPPAVLPSESDTQQELASLGLSPQNLCILGLNATQTSSLVTTAVDAIETQWEQLQSTRQSVLTLMAETAMLKQSVAQGVAEEADHAALALAQESLDSSNASLANILSLIQTDVESHLSLDQIATLGRLVENASLPVPVQYHVLEKTSVEWVYFRKAYAQCQTNENPSPEAQSLVDSANADYQVNLAQVNLDTNLEVVRVALQDVLSAIAD